MSPIACHRASMVRAPCFLRSSLSLAKAVCRLSRNSRQYRRDKTRTGKKNPGQQETQRWSSGDRPPPGMMQWTCGW